jgi:dUTP pyrophosphatase
VSERVRVRLLLFNFTAEPFDVRTGDRVAQLVFERVGEPELEIAESLDETERAGGFGSTGLR